MKKFITIVAFTAVILIMSAQAEEGNTIEVKQFINSQIGGYPLVFPQSNALPQPSRRDVAGAVLLDLEAVNNNVNTVGDIPSEKFIKR